MLISYAGILYLTPIVAAMLVTVSLGVLAYRRRGVAGALLFAITMGLEAVWLVGYVLELLTLTLSGKIFWENFQYLGTLLAPLMLLAFAFQYCDRPSPSGWRLWAGLSLPALVVLVLTFTNPWHHLALLNQHLLPDEPFAYYTYDFGLPVYVVLFYNYVLMLWAIYLLWARFLRQTGLARRQTGFVLAGILIPVVSSVTIFFKIPIFPQRDISPYYFAVSDLFIAYGLFYYRLFDIVPFARDLVMENMADGVVVVDPLGHLLDVNPAARLMLGISSPRSPGQLLTDLLPGWLEQLSLNPPARSIHQAVTLDRPGGPQVLDVLITRLINRSGVFSGHMLLLRDITDRQRAEADLRASEERFRALFEHSPDAVLLIDPHSSNPPWAIVDCNEVAERLNGYPRAELLGRSVDFLNAAPPTPTEHADYLERLARSGSLQYETQHRRRDGTLVPVEVSTALVTLAGRQLVLGIDRDITERRQTQAALQASEEQLRRVTENMRDVITQIDADGVIRYCSPSHGWVLGIPPESVIGHSIFERLHPADVAEAALALQQAFGPGAAPAPVTFRYQHSDGRYRWVECIGSQLFDATGAVTGAVLSSRDITARRAVETALRDSERRYRLLAENATDVIWVRDLNLRLTYLSPAIEKLCGFSIDAALQQDLAQALTPASARRSQTSMAELLAAARRQPPGALGRPTLTLEAEYRCQDGSTVWTESQVSLLLDEHGQPAEFLGVTRNIAERRRAADALRRANAQLEDRVRDRTLELTRVNADLVMEIRERQQAERRGAAFSALGQQLSAATTPAAAAEVILATADQLLGWDACFLDLYWADQDLIQTALAIDTCDGQRTRLHLGQGLRTPPPILRQVFAEGGQLLLSDDPRTAWPDMETFGDSSPLPASLLFAPIQHGAQVLGCLSIQSFARNAYDRAGLQTLQALADHCAGALERIQSEERIRASLRDKEVLLKEIHHRVKNNLQVISSLLNLQSRQVSDPRALEFLRSSQTRVRSMALVHEKLYRSADLAHFDFAEYIRGLASQLVRTYGDQAAGVVLTVRAIPCELDVELAMACGLILNELISNALKHAFPGGRGGELCLTLERAPDDRVRLRVGDDGAGWPAGLDFHNSPSLGLQLVNTLVDQIGGTIQLVASPGTQFVIEFSAAQDSG